MKYIRRRVSEFLLVAVFVGIVYPDRPLDNVRRFLRENEQQVPVKKYSQDQIEASAPHLEIFHPRLLVWSEDEGFRVYNLDHQDSHYQKNMACGRCAKIVSLMVHALMEHHGDRFQPGQPVFQMLWSDADSFQSQCVNEGANCKTDEFSPIPLFGSVPKDPEVLPTVKAMPNWFYMDCLYNWKLGVTSPDGNCWNEHVNHDVTWDKLIPTAVWRGSDFTFLPSYADHSSFLGPKNMQDFIETYAQDDHTPESLVMELFDHWKELNPRWRAIALSAQAQLYNETWIDAKFVGPMREESHEKFLKRGVAVAAPDHMDASDMSGYKYQLDLGGGGGTSWRGTLTKLEMPGVLFHHETPTKDWWYKEMKEYKHYIPINADLTDLKAKVQWAQKSDSKAKQIAHAGTELANYLFSEEYMKKVHNDLFVNYLGNVVDSYIHNDMPWAESVIQYKSKGFTLTEVAYCRSSRCYTNVRDDIYRTFPYVDLLGSGATSDDTKNAFAQTQAALVMAEANKKVREGSASEEQPENNSQSKSTTESAAESWVVEKRDSFENQQPTQTETEEFRNEEQPTVSQDPDPTRIIVNEDRVVYFVDDLRTLPHEKPEQGAKETLQDNAGDFVNAHEDVGDLGSTQKEKEKITSDNEGSRVKGQTMTTVASQSLPRVSFEKDTQSMDSKSRSIAGNTRSDEESIISTGDSPGRQASIGSESPEVFRSQMQNNDVSPTTLEQVKDIYQIATMITRPIIESADNAEHPEASEQFVSEHVEVSRGEPQISDTTQQIQASADESSLTTNDRSQSKSNTISSDQHSMQEARPVEEMVLQPQGDGRTDTPRNSNHVPGEYTHASISDLFESAVEANSRERKPVVETTQGNAIPRSSKTTKVLTGLPQPTEFVYTINPNDSQPDQRTSPGQVNQRDGSQVLHQGPAKKTHRTSSNLIDTAQSNYNDMTQNEVRASSSSQASINLVENRINTMPTESRMKKPSTKEAYTNVENKPTKSKPTEDDMRSPSTKEAAPRKKVSAVPQTFDTSEKAKAQKQTQQSKQQAVNSSSKVTKAAREEMSKLVLIAEEEAVM